MIFYPYFPLVGHTQNNTLEYITFYSPIIRFQYKNNSILWNILNLQSTY